MSDTNIKPGSWVIMKSILFSIAMTCGVTPHAQKTGIVFSGIDTASPKSGFNKFVIPMVSGEPICTGGHGLKGTWRSLIRPVSNLSMEQVSC